MLNVCAAGLGWRRARTVSKMVLDTNVDGIARLQAAGWTDAWGAPRMIRGEMPAWQPNAIWGQFDHAVG